MRPRPFLTEPPSSSICAFCTYRLRASRRPPFHLQYRRLRSFHPLRENSAADSAPTSETRNRADSKDSHHVPTFGNLRTTSGATAASWGRPGAANGTAAQAGFGASWGRPSRENTDTQFLSSDDQQSRLRAIADELLPHEQRARELLVQKRVVEPARELNVKGRRPENTRAVRPRPMSKDDRFLIRKVPIENKKAQEENNFQRQGPGTSQSPIRIRRMTTDGVFSPSGAKSVAITDEPDSGEGETASWSQLRRRQDLSNQEAHNDQMSSFIEGRMRREEFAKRRSYTPLKPGSEAAARWTAVEKSGDRPWTSPRTTKTSHSGPLRAFSPLADESMIQNERQRERPGQEENEIHNEPQITQSSRFADTKPSYKDVPKGRTKDKMRRRQQFIEDEEDDTAARREALQKAEEKKRKKAEKAAKKAAAPTPIILPEYISTSNLAVALRVRFEDFVERMEELGYEDTQHDYILNAEDAGLIAMEFNYEAIIDRSESEDLRAREPPVDPSSLPSRPPVVTIMGHVDHGKTTLLDWLRKSSVAATEHGGITQHIGAFSVPMPSGKTITFLDTPGHAAFLSMRQRGANVTDIVILVVAADDSVKPQTIEAISHAQAAKVPIIVAINKIDKPDINIDRVKQDLARHGVEIEDFGGDTQVVCVSGKTGEGMDKLEEAAMTLSEIQDMRAEVDGPAEGWILEASIKSMGKVATVLVKRGTVRPGDFIVAGSTWARVRCLRNEAGIEIEEAGPGMPVEIDGWREQPLAGDEVLQAPDESKAKSVIEYRLERIERDKMAEDMEAVNVNRKVEQVKRDKEKEAIRLAKYSKGSDDLATNPVEEKPTGPTVVNFIVKGDVSGSVEAVVDSISHIGNKEVEANVIRSGVGQLSEFDVEHAAAAEGHLINFNTTVDPHIARLADQANVKILDHNIIYRLVDSVKQELSKRLPPLITQRVTGEAEIAQVFSIKMKKREMKNIAGCKVRNGSITRNAKVRVLRNNEKIFDGTLSSLKNVKKDVLEMKKGTECGIGFESWTDFEVGDLVQSYEEKEERYL